MCVLVVSDYPDTLDPGRLAEISSHISALVCDARLEHRSVAFLHRKDGSGFGHFGLRIGRYDPIFTMSACGNVISAGLAEFVVRRAAQPIRLAGVASAAQFRRLRDMFQMAGYASQIESRSTLMLDAFAHLPEAHDYEAVQFSEYGPFLCGDSACAASRKNQSTRWPSA